MMKHSIAAVRELLFFRDSSITYFLGNLTLPAQKKGNDSR